MRRRRRHSTISVTVTKRNIWTGSPARNATKRDGDDWKQRSSGLPKARFRTGDIT